MDGHDCTGPRAARGGFSLIEVALALMVAASGMLAAFSLFPASLRQSAESHSYMVESTFASTVLETIASNVRQIDDIAVWNDPKAWFDKAFSTGFASKPARLKAADVRDGFERGDQKVGALHLPTLQIAENFEEKDGGIREIWYTGREAEHKDTAVPSADTIAEPPQWVMRIHVIKRPARSGGLVQKDSRIPNRYLLTMVSSPDVSPARYTDNASYSQEYVFLRRP